MLADAHKQAAADNERAALDLGDPTTKPHVSRGIIELYWGAAFHWLAIGCQQKHGKHKENHSGLVSYLRQQGEPEMAVRWENLERVRNAGWYGGHTTASNVQEAERLCQEIRTWALS